MALQYIPQPGQTLAATQAPILDNFMDIDSAFTANHVGINDPLQGFHNSVEMPPQLAAPGATANDNIIYSKIPAAPYPLTAINESFIHKQVAGVAQSVDIPFTASVLSNDAAPGFASDGWTYLPSGILMKWGSIIGSFPNGMWQPYLFPVANDIPVFQEIFNITLQAVSQDIIPATAQTFNYLTINSIISDTGFSWIPRTNFGNVNQLAVLYFAIGK